MASQPHRYVTPEEYLTLERQAETRSEYLDGVIVAMAGASLSHILITGNLYYTLRSQLRGRSCSTYSGDMRVKIPAHNLYTYPDLVVVCGEPRFEATELANLLNPTLIIEVLSDSTANYDRGKKFAFYRTLPSLREYLLVAQDEYRIDYYRREADGNWFIGDAHGRDASLALTTGDCILDLAAIYEGVDLLG